MALRRKLARLWQVLFQRSRLDRELDEELRAYLNDLIEKKIAAGADPAAARREAMLEMGGVTQVRADVQRIRIGAGIDALWHDIRFTCRTLVRKPAFAVVAILTFALGIGANTAIFSVVNETLIQPLPYKDSSQLAFVWADSTAIGYPRGPLSGPELKDLRQHGTMFSAFDAIWGSTSTITGDGDPQQMRIGFVTTLFFDTLGAQAFLGRTFNDSDSGDRAPGVLLSWALWQRRYGGDPAIVGRSINVNGQPTVVVGVMAADFRLLFPPDASVPEDLEAWLPFWNVTEGLRRQNFLRVIARMKPGVDLAQAHDEVSQIAARISREYTDYGSRPRAFNLVGLQADGAREIRPGLLALLGGVAILLLTACLNVASLLIARAAARTRETALRLAIGASQAQIVRQCLVEGLVLAIAGGIAGALFAQLSLRVLLALRPPALSRLSSAGIDGVVLAFAAGTALFCGILFSFAPMIEVFRTDVIGGLLGSIRRVGTARYRARVVLVTLQIAFGLVLLIGAGLLMRTFIHIQQLDPGYSSGRILAFRLSPPADASESQIVTNDFHRRMQSELAALPGVTGVGAVSHYPFDNIPNWGSPYLSREGQEPGTAIFADFRSVSPGYLETIGAQLLEGRFFSEADDNTSGRPVVIVDDLLAKRSWPGESAVGKRIAVDPAVTGRDDRRRWATVIGVVRHMRIRSLVEDLTDQVYFSIRQVPRPTSYVVRAAGDPTALVASTRDLIRKLEPQVPVYDVRLLDSYLEAPRSVKRFTMQLALAFAGVALVLAFIGVYGLVMYSVNTRRYEFGVRVALGAQSGEILRLVMREGILLLSAGIALGIAGAAVTGRFLESQLFGVSAVDVPTYAIALAVIAAAGLLASWLPARKASVSNPLEIIRTE